MHFPSIDIQGAILSADLLSKIRSEQASYQQGKDFDPELSNAKLKDEISLVWREVRDQWNIFKSKKARLKDDDNGTTETRNFWIVPLLTNLGYNLSFSKSAEEINGKVFPIGFRDTKLEGFPVYVGSFKESLDRRPESKLLRVSPHAMVQEYLNHSEHLYGLVTNGHQLRLLRDASRITRLSYVEFNLEKMMEEDLYADFVILYRLLHASRMPKRMDGGAESIIDKYHLESLEAGSTIRSKLGDAVKMAIQSLANGFINHPNNVALREAVASPHFSTEEYYRHQLRIIYRLLFLFVIEERNLVYGASKSPETKRFNQIYTQHFSLMRLRKKAKQLLPPEATRHHDLWQGLITTFSLFEKKEIGEKLGIMALQGDLFGYHAIQGQGYDLHHCQLSNAELLNILKSLSYFENEQGVLIAVNYGGLDVEEFGSVYEGLLELKLDIQAVPGSDRYSCSFNSSNERSKSGSHYTPEELVQPLIKHSLEYLIQERVASGEWRVADGKEAEAWQRVSSKYPAIQEQLKNLILNLSLEYEKLSGLGSVAQGHGFSPNDLPINQLLSQRRIVWDDFAAPPLVKFYSSQHSGGMGTQQQQGVHPLSEHRQGQSFGNRNTPAAGSKSETLPRGTNSTPAAAFGSAEQAAAFVAAFHLSPRQLAQVWNQLPLAIRHSLFATHHLLNLKIADVACGSGHILLSAARRLSLEIARVQTEEEQPNPVAIRKAMKEVVRHCIYGVDKNPLAVELCKIALWLEAYNPGEPLNFLDHHIKCGDAIVGLAHRSELQKGIADEAFKTLPGDDKDIAKNWRDRNSRERKSREPKGLQLQYDYDRSADDSLKEAINDYKAFTQLPEGTPEQIEQKAKAYQQFIKGKGFGFLKTMADTQVAQFFIPKTEANKDYIITDADFRQILAGYKGWQDRRTAKASVVAQEKRFFHWFIEFPEVFGEGGFDCVLGNPPFLGGKKISTFYGLEFSNWLKWNFPATGSADLVAYFFRRAFDIAYSRGFVTFISTNTISQGDTREVGLEKIINNGGRINFAIKSTPWPGVAAVDVSLVSITKSDNIKFYLGQTEVSYISSYLDSGELVGGSPDTLHHNLMMAFIGTLVHGKGFILTLKEANLLLEKNDKNLHVIKKYLGGDDVNSSPKQETARYVIDFQNRNFEECEEFKECLDILIERVKPQRDEVYKKGKQIHEPAFWKFWDKRPELYEKIRNSRYALVCAAVTKYVQFSTVETSFVFSHKLIIIPTDSFYLSVFLNSAIHNEWVSQFSSTLGAATINYSVRDAFETFPFPKNVTEFTTEQVNALGLNHHKTRSAFMVEIQLGLTKTYNLFHSDAITSAAVNEKDKQVIALHKHLEKTEGTISFEEAIAGILKLRALHVEMDQAVLEAYGWSDIALRHDFYEVDYLPENDRIRFTIHPDARKEILKRLLALNHQIHAEEVAQGLWEKKKALAKGKQKEKKEDEGYGGLFEMEDDAS